MVSIIHAKAYSYSAIFLTPLFLISGCGDSDEGSTASKPTIDPRSTISFSDARADFDTKLLQVANNTPEFNLRVGLSAYEVGSFLQDGALHGSLDIADQQLTLNSFEEISYRFELDEKDASYKDADTSLKVIPGFSFTLGAGSNNAKVKTINYTISLSDITLTKLKNPVHAILSGGSDTGAANEFIYGVYSAKIKYGISFYDEYAKEITLGAGFETDLFSAETNVKKSSSSQISSKYKFESVAPVQIGFLKRNIASINRIPTSLKLALDPNNANLINITWKAVENASYYNIFQSETAGINANSTSTYSQKITVEDPFYTFEGAPNQSYYFKVSSTVNRQESETGLEDGIQTIPGDETPPGDGPIDGGGNSKQPEVEPNNDINSAQEIRAGVVSGQKTTAQDYNDVFKLIPSKTALDFKVIHEKQYSATSDYDIYIYNHNEELIHSFPSYNGENDQHIIGVEKNKPVYIKMNMKNDTTINDRYNLELGFLNYNYELEPNNALSDANLLLNNTTKRGSRSFRSDYRDYYYINTESNTLRVKFTHSDKLSASSNYTIYIYNATEEQISKVKAENGMDVDFNIGVELNSRIYIRVDIDGDNSRDIHYSINASFE